MIENVMHGIGGVGLFGIISIVIFFAFFTGVLVWAFRLNKGYLCSLETLPLDEDGAPERPAADRAIACAEGLKPQDQSPRAPASLLTPGRGFRMGAAESNNPELN